MILPITLTIAAAAALLNLWLAYRIVRVRMAAKVMHGDGGNSLLANRMRAQSNFIEYTPIVLILLGLVEMARGTNMWLWAAGIAYIVARILHAFGLERAAPNPLRAIGIAVTMIVMIGLAIYGLSIVYMTPMGPSPLVTAP